MAASFHLEIITPERLKYTDDVVSVVLPGVEGELGLLMNHAPILALLQPGVLRLRTAAKEIVMAVGQGFVKMSQNRAVCLVDFAEQGDEVHREQATQERATLEKALASALSEAEREPLRHALRAQQARLEVAGKGA